jgi:hypothetical protein
MVAGGQQGLKGQQIEESVDTEQTRKSERQFMRVILVAAIYWVISQTSTPVLDIPRILCTIHFDRYITHSSPVCCHSLQFKSY